MSEQLIQLAKPFPAKLVNKAPAGKHGEYINHAVINQRLLQILGPFSFKVVRELNDDGRITGAVCALTLTIDGKEVEIMEVGDVDDLTTRDGEYVDKTNGARLKKASSDAFKRAAMRVGVGLHLWSKGDYFLYERLLKEGEE